MVCIEGALYSEDCVYTDDWEWTMFDLFEGRDALLLMVLNYRGVPPAPYFGEAISKKAKHTLVRCIAPDEETAQNSLPT